MEQTLTTAYSLPGLNQGKRIPHKKPAKPTTRIVAYKLVLGNSSIGDVSENAYDT
jgi:hypothetical protein